MLYAVYDCHLIFVMWSWTMELRLTGDCQFGIILNWESGVGEC